MDDLHKLHHLIEHWIEHNREHAEAYREWAIKARAMGREDLAGLLEEVAGKTLEAGEMLGKAEKVAGH